MVSYCMMVSMVTDEDAIQVAKIGLISLVAMFALCKSLLSCCLVT